MVTAPSITPDESKLLEEACRRYPVTVKELERALPLRKGAFDLALRGLVRKGLVALEPLEDCTFVRPLANIGQGPRALPRDEHDPAFG